MHQINSAITGYSYKIVSPALYFSSLLSNLECSTQNIIDFICKIYLSNLFFLSLITPHYIKTETYNSQFHT